MNCWRYIHNTMIWVLVLFCVLGFTYIKTREMSMGEKQPALKPRNKSHWAAFQLNKQLNKAAPCRVLICLTRPDANIRKLWWLDSYWPVDLKSRMSSVSSAGSNALSVSVLLERMCALRYVFYVICSAFHEAKSSWIFRSFRSFLTLISTTVTSCCLHVLMNLNIKPSHVSTVTEAF